MPSIFEVGVNIVGEAIMCNIARERERSVQGGMYDRSAV